MPVTPFKLYLENKMISKKNITNFKKEAFVEKCKMEWNNMPDKAKLFWINYAFEQKDENQEKMKNNEKFSLKHSSCQSILTKNKQPISISMANQESEKPVTSTYTYPLFYRSMLDSEEVIKLKPKEKSLYIAQCWQNFKQPKKREYDNIINQLPTLKLDKNLISKTSGETSKDIDNSKNLKPTPTKDINDFLTNGPEMPPTCAYYLFMKNYNDLYPHSNDAIIIWRKLSAKDKDIYNNILHDMRKQYAIDYKNFLEGNNLAKIENYVINVNKTHSNHLD